MPQELEKRGSVADHLHMAVEAGRIGMWELDTESGESWRNAMHDRIFGYDEPLANWSYDDFLQHVLEEDRQRVDGLYGSALANQTEWAFECRIRRRDGLVRWINAHGRPMPTAEDQPLRLIGHVLDVTDTKRNEEHLELVTAELNHRLQNIIATISGLIGLAAREGGDRIENATVLQERLRAIGRSHNVGYRERSDNVAILDVLEAERKAMPAFAERIAIDVDKALTINANIAERLTLIIHELGTNAVKYGALSNETGTISVASRSGQNDQMLLVWKESGGPTVVEPERKGFGTKLINNSLRSDAHVSQEFEADGLVCTIAFPASEVTVEA